MKKLMNVLREGAGFLTIVFMIVMLAIFVIWSTQINNEKIKVWEQIDAAIAAEKEETVVEYRGNKFRVFLDPNDPRKSEFILIK